MSGGAHVTLLLGGVRSGKSARAVSLATALQREAGGRVLFVATAQALDEEMRHRIAVHQRQRPADWDTLESPLDLPADLRCALTASPEPYAAVVIDCVTLWTSNVLLSLAEDDDAETDVAGRVQALLDVRARAGGRWIIVSNEVGLGVVPPTALGRRYRDALGRANQLLAAAADDVQLMVAGLIVPLAPRVSR